MAGNIIASAIPVDMVNFKRLVSSISAEYAVCVRGRHAVGKSEGVYQAGAEIYSDFYKDPHNCAKVVQAFGGRIKTADGWISEWNYDLGIPVLERRLSQMTEGDIIGLPFRHGKDLFDQETGRRISSASTSFKPCDWLINACEYPVILFLDERNRALEGVKQAVFQLTDSKAFYGNHLHEETRVVVAENEGDEYQIQQCDPAEVSRCVTVVLEPSVKDWLTYATPRCNEATIEFIRQNERLLENRESFEPNKKYPDRRSWFKLDQEAQRLNFFSNPTDQLFYVMASGFIGVEAGTKFISFVKERNREVSAKDILTNWEKARKRLAGKATITNEQYVECSNKIDTWLEKNSFSVEEAEQLSKFMQDSPAEVMMTTWCNLQKDNKKLILTHKFIQNLLMASMTGGDVKDVKLPSLEEVKAILATSNPQTSNEPVKEKKRGAKK